VGRGEGAVVQGTHEVQAGNCNECHATVKHDVAELHADWHRAINHWIVDVQIIAQRRGNGSWV